MSEPAPDPTPAAAAAQPPDSPASGRAVPDPAALRPAAPAPDVPERGDPERGDPEPGDLQPGVTDPSPAGARPSRTRRAVAAAATARDRTAGGVAATLVPLIRATRIPLALVALYPAVSAVVLLVVALIRPGPDDWFWVVVAGVGLVLAAWLALRRRQLLDVARDRDRLSAALAATVSGHQVWDQVQHNLGRGSGARAVTRRSRPLRIVHGMWAGVRMTGIVGELIERPEIAPLLPGRLRGIWMLVLASLVIGTVLWIAVLVAALIFLVGG